MCAFLISAVHSVNGYFQALAALNLDEEPPYTLDRRQGVSSHRLEAVKNKTISYLTGTRTLVLLLSSP
jgi:hypothetical protein